MDPHQKKKKQGNRYVHKHHEREKATAQRAGGNEIAGNRLAEDRETVQQFRCRDGHILRKPVPHQPIAGNSRTIEQPNDR